LTVLLIFGGCYSVFGLTLDALFMDNMVLQRDAEIPVFGTADPGAEITVEFAGQKKTAVADSSRHWKAMLDPMPASTKPLKMSISSNSNTPILQYSNLLIGDIWLCGGQSNMDTPVQNYPFLAEALAGVSNDQLRLFDVVFDAAAVPQNDVSGEGIYQTWLAADDASIPVFSAVGICFGLRLQQGSGVPVGLIESAVGGSEISPWMPAAALEAMGESSLQAPADRGLNPRQQPAAFYNGMIHALRRLPIKGVIWYQGESNADKPSIVRYDRLFEKLIVSWRDVFENPDLAFYFVQLAPYGQVHWDQSGESWAWLREAQEKALSLPNTGRVVITDLGEFADIHPADKRPVGDRLADLALRDMGLLKAPGFPMVATPLRSVAVAIAPASLDFVSGGNHRIAGRRVQIDFSNVGKGLKTVRVAMNNQPKLAPGTDPEAFVAEPDELAGFAVCGPDRAFVPATVRIVDEDTVEVWSDSVAEPVAVRYGWENFPLCNLANSDGLPVSPFRTDDFSMPVFKAPFLESGSADEPLPVGAVKCADMKRPDESRLVPEVIAGRDALRVNKVTLGTRMAYFYAGDRDSDLRHGKHQKQTLVVNYLDDGPGLFEIKYDAVSEPWKSAGIVEMKGSGEWRRVTVDLDDAQFTGRCNGADIRLEGYRDFYVSGVYSVP
jgi:sialate O-acetylesterase